MVDSSWNGFCYGQEEVSDEVLLQSSYPLHFLSMTSIANFVFSECWKQHYLFIKGFIGTQ